MIIHVETHEREKYAAELAAYFRLRKTVFHDRLGWNVPVEGDQERDLLDDQPNTYALSLTANGSVNAGIRLIPTTQTTLLELAFDGLIPDACNFRSPTIWELSRFCVDHGIGKGRLPSGLDRATLELTIANVDYARRNGITHYLAVTEERVFELSRQFSAAVEVLGRQTIDGCNVVCGLLTVDAHARKAADQVRPFAGGVAAFTPEPQPSGTNATSRDQESAA
jgi:N-acyl-L-homoserine lactone synthetase